MEHFRTYVVAALLTAFFPAAALSQTYQLPAGFTETRMPTNGINLHVVKGGKGPAVVLLHGWPQSWYAWRKVMPLLARDHTVVAVDLRGIGGSDAPEKGYDTPTLATDVRGVVTALGLKDVTLVGHDIGGMVAYAYARLFPKDLRVAVIVEATVPGLGEWEAQKNSARAWHMNFHQQTGLTETLVQGREEEYLKFFYRRAEVYPTAITDADLKIFAEAYRDPAHLKGGFGFYRAFPVDEEFAKAHKDRLDLPIRIVSGERQARRARDERAAEDMRAHGATDVAVEVISGAGHYIPDEQPEALVARIRAFAKN